MREYVENGIRVLEPDGDLWLTTGDGYTYSKKVLLGKDADASKWKEKPWDGTYPEDDDITAEEALEILLGGDSE